MKRILILSALLLAFGCSETKQEAPGQKQASSAPTQQEIVFGDALVDGSIADAINLIPLITTDGSSHDVAGNVYNGLIKYDKNLTMTGDLAESWEISADKLTITFHLRKGVTWHDGKPFTAHDVKFTYDLLLDDKTPTSYDSDFRKVKSVVVVDDHTVKVTYPEPYAPALNGWGMWIMPKHLLEGEDITKSPLQRHPIGTGPYMFEEWKPGESITLKANPNYFEGRPNIAKTVTRVIPDQATMFLELLGGNIDLMSMTPLQFAKQTATERFSSQYNKYRYLSSGYTYIGYNLKKPMFQDKRVRQALTYATPKQRIIDSILFGNGIPANGPYKPGTLWYNDKVKPYDYDLEQAKALLAEAGWTDSNGDGVLDKGGKPFSFELITNQGNTTRSQIAEIVQQSWAQIGVKVEIRILEWATFINEYINKKNFDATILGWNILIEPDLYDVWHSETCDKNTLNFVCFQNKEVDALMEQGMVEYDPEKRAVFYRKIQEILAEEQPYTFLYVPYSLVAVSNRIHGVEPSPSGLTHNMIKWYVPQDQQKYHFQP